MKFIFGKLVIFCSLFILLVSTGCETLDSGGAQAPGDDARAHEIDILRSGDRVRISFSGLPPEQQMLPQDEQINESGNISLPYLKAPIKAAGKSVSQLQTEIRGAYVPDIFKNLSVSVTTERYYFVGGEVKVPGRQPYLGGLTVLKAIQSAQDFTDFADRKHVRLTRSNGKTEIVNCKKALENPKLDLPVYPGDTVTVPRGF